jgi:hypothetical protein
VKAALWAVCILVVTIGIVWGVMAINAHEHRQDRRCADQGGERVYTKSHGYYCVIVLYKE